MVIIDVKYILFDSDYFRGRPFTVSFLKLITSDQKSRHEIIRPSNNLQGRPCVRVILESKVKRYHKKKKRERGRAEIR